MTAQVDILESDNRTGLNHEGGTANTPVSRLTAQSIIGDKVINSEGENLGTINDLMVNIRSGVVEYAVIEFGTVLGIGGKLFAIPYSELLINEQRRCFVIDRSKDDLKNLPGFDKNHWPYTNDHYYVNVQPMNRYQFLM